MFVCVCGGGGGGRKGDMGAREVGVEREEKEERKTEKKNYPAPAPPFGQQARKTRAATLAVLPAE